MTRFSEERLCPDDPVWFLWSLGLEGPLAWPPLSVSGSVCVPFSAHTGSHPPSFLTVVGGGLHCSGAVLSHDLYLNVT